MADDEQIARVRRIKASAETVFENREVAQIWLSEPNPALDNRVPRDLLLADADTGAVEAVLRRIEYGDYG